MIAIQHHATVCTDVSTYAERFLDERATFRACLTGILSRHGNDGNIVHHYIGFNPMEELSPSSIMDGLSEMMVLDHIAYLEVLIGNQIARCDKRVRLLAGEILTLPTHLQIGFCQLSSGLLAVLALFLLAGYLPMQAFQPFLSLPQVW